MTSTPYAALQLVAQEGKAPGEGGGLLSPSSPVFPLLMIGLVFYLMILRPQRKQEKERQASIDALRKNDEVVTSSGIVGTVVSLKKDKDEVLLESGTSRFRILKTSIARVLNRSDAPSTSGTDDDGDSK